jgi:hypothetical protein
VPTKRPSTIGTISHLEDDKRLKTRGISEEAETLAIDIEQHAKDRGLTRIVESIFKT